MRATTIALLLFLITGAILLAAAQAGAQDNHTPETAEPLDQYNYITEFVNGTNDSAEYWYWVDIQRGQELFVYFYGDGEGWYNKSRLLYYVHGPDSWASNAVVHAESWYRNKQRWEDHTDYWSWICPSSGRYYFHFFAYQQAKGDFHVQIDLDSPKEMFRFWSNAGTLWWNTWDDINKNDIWRIWLEAGEQDLEGVQVTLRWTDDHRLHLYGYDLVDSYEQNLLNLSYAFSGDRVEVIRFTASYTGWYYVRVEYSHWSGSQAYTLNTREYSAPNDGDNDIDNATRVLKTASIQGHMEASRDMHDWFAVDLVEGDLLGISMQIMDPYNPDYNPGAANYRNFFEIQVYDPQMRRVNHGYDRNGGWPIPDTYINNLPIQPADIKVNGTYHIRASFSWSYGYYYDATNTSGTVIAFCDYQLQLTIPNRAPRVNETALEDVVMLEDTTWWEDPAGHNVSSLDLNTVFIDPEVGVLEFSVRGNKNVTAILVENAVQLRPKKDWNGEADIRLMVEDDSGNDVVAFLHVIVVPVNDPPRSGLPVDIRFPEDDPSEENRTFNMYDMFYDVDEEDREDLTFEMGEHQTVSAVFDQATWNVTFTTAEDWNGQLYVTFWAYDTHGASTSVEVTIHVTPVNDAPKALDGEASFTFEEGFALETFDAADHLYDPDGDASLRWYVEYVDPADEGVLVITNEGREPLNSDMVVTPATGKHDWFGTVVVNIICMDERGLTGVKEFNITITNTPDPPSIAAWTPRANPTFGEGETYTFSVDDVRDPDGEDARIHFSFRLKGPGNVSAMEVQNTTSRAFVMETGFDDEGVYTLTVVVFDEDLMSSVNPLDWIVTITKTNRVPRATIVTPSMGDVFKEGEWIDFEAAVEDPDAEDQSGLVVEWYEGDEFLGQGGTFSIRNLKPGEHIISILVTDPDGASVEEPVTIMVKEVDEEPGFGPVAALAAFALLALLRGGKGTLRKRR